MTGDSHSNDDSDFLDDDFVVEDLVADNEELEDLFETPAPAAGDSKAPAAEAASKESVAGEAPAPADEEDLLFSDHTEGLAPTEEFQKPTFAEDGPTEWDGSELDLESVGVPDASLEAEEEAADPDLAEAEQSFVEELDSLLHSDEEFAVEATDEFELVDLDVADDDGVSELEQSGPFVLDDGDGLWSEGLEAAASEELVFDEADSPAPAEADAFDVEELPVFAEADGEDFDDRATVVSEDATGFGAQADGEALFDNLGDVDNLELLETANGQAGDPGWEPLPSRSMDGLSEVDEVQRTDEEPYDQEGYEEDFDDADDYEDYVDGDEEYVEGHDIYGEQEDEGGAVVVGGPGSSRGRTRALFLSMAASLAIIGGAATIVARPAWFGLSVEPDQVAKVTLDRPEVAVTVAEPRRVPVASENAPAAADEVATGAGVGGESASGELPAKPTTVAPTSDEAETSPSNGEAAGSLGGAAGDARPDVAGADNVAAGALPVASKPDVSEQPTSPVVVAPVATADQNPGDQNPGDAGQGEANTAWPVASGEEPGKPADDGAGLAPFGDGLLVGGASAMKDVNARDGVMPGSRAFAQLHNGNYFIGRVKQVAEESVTLRLSSGEITLANAEIAQLTRLGSSDYEALQRATKGFVRLTNNNRLVGGILSTIADDHIVLEFRSNRVMLPKDLVGEVVSGPEGGSQVRLGTTSEEETWVRGLAERELGSGGGGADKVKTTGQPPR